MVGQIIEGEPAGRKPGTQNDFGRGAKGSKPRWKRLPYSAGNSSFRPKFACTGF